MPKASPPHILLAEDDISLAESIREFLELKGYRVTSVEDGDFAIDLIEHEAFDVVLTDCRMPVMDGMELLATVKKLRPKLPVILMTAHSTTDLAINATKQGAFDYIIKPFEVPDLLNAIAKAVATSQLAKKALALGSHDPTNDSIVGTSRKMQDVFKEIGRVAERPIPVLIRGETGTGKELVARAIFQYSNRPNKPFVAVNCAAIPDTLIESELFGHEKGAFTNAISQRIGRFEQADGGTLFLDEIGDLPWQTQVKLLRVLQEKVIQRVGGKETISVNVRIISATHRDLEKMIVEGTFREDLYFRLNAAIIPLPPLRERLGDLNALVPYFAAKYAREFEMDTPSIQPEAMERLAQHHWPGNVRELENIVRRAMIECHGLTISSELVHTLLQSSGGKATQNIARDDSDVGPGFEEHIRQVLLEASRGDLSGRGALAVLYDELEQILYQHAIVISRGNQTNMAKWIGVSRLTIREKLDKYVLFPKRERRTP